MTTNTRNLLINIAASFVTASAVAVLAFNLNRGALKADVIDKKLSEKAPYDYVDMKAGAVKDELDIYKVEQNERHKSENQQTQEKLNIIIELIKAKK